jgi:hypothetical protein
VGVVACREFGLNYLRFDDGQNCDYDDFWIDNTYCTGTESRIGECQHSLWGDHRCDSTI